MTVAKNILCDTIFFNSLLPSSYKCVFMYLSSGERFLKLGRELFTEYPKSNIKDGETFQLKSKDG